MDTKLNNTSKNKFDYRDIIWLTVLSLYFSRFPIVGDFLPIVILIYVVIYIFGNGVNKSTLGMVVTLFSFSILHTFFQFIYGEISIINSIGRLLFPITLYYFGFLIIRNDNDYKVAHKYLITTIFVYTFYGFLSLQRAIYTFGSFEASRIINGRTVFSIWDGSPVSATILNMSLSFGLSLLSLFLTNFKGIKISKKNKIIYFICFALSTYTVFTLGNRSGILILVLAFFISFIFADKMNVSKVFRVLGMVVLLIFFFSLYQSDLLGIRSFFEDTLIFGRMNQSMAEGDPRVAAWVAAFNGMFQYPLGGRRASLPLGFAHNMWLDVGYVGGLIPFTLLLLFTIKTIISLGELLTKWNHPLLIKRIFLALYVGVMITFFVEPIMEGGFTFFTTFCFFVGLLDRLNYNQKKILLENNYGKIEF